MSMELLSALYYAYPASLCVTLLASYLFSYSQQKSVKNENLHHNRSFTLIWWLQAGLLLALCASIFGSVMRYQKEISYKIDLQFFQAELASFIALTVYFGSGLLPDPDGPFTPERPNFHTWILALWFEVTIEIVDQLAVKELGHVKLMTSVLAVLRIVLLLLIGAIFLHHDRLYLRSNAHGTDPEREAIIVNNSSTFKYGTSSSTPISRASVGGWLDYFYGFRGLFPYIWPSDSKRQQLVTVFCFALLVFQRIINVMVPHQLGELVDSLGQGQQGITGSLRAILWIPISQSLYRRLTSATYSHVLLLSLDFHLSKRIGEVISALGKGGALNTFLDGFAFQLFPMVLDLGVAAVWLFIQFDAIYSIIVVAVMWNYIFVTIYMAKYRGKSRREMATRERNMEAAKTDAIMAYETVHYNNAVPLETSKFRQLVTTFQKAEFSILLSLNVLNATQNGIFILGVIIVCGLSAYQISIGVHKVSDFVELISYFAQLQAPLAFYGSFYNQVQNNLVDAERMLELFNTTSDIQDNLRAKPIERIQGRITVSNLTFAYRSTRPALDDISFTVDHGTSTAIVGESGRGKSTILKLLFRFYEPLSGSIFIDNVNMQDITIKSLRKHIGFVPQDTVLFNETILYNLLYAREDATEEEAQQACRAASIHDKILGFPEGYQTMVGERGLKLSGGKKQRVAIARAILKNPQIMLLDEATTSLDTATERLVQGALDNVTTGRTTITIALRLSTVTHADQILVMDKGRIVERGTHSKLLALGGIYANMWEKQTETVKEKDV